MKKLIRRGWQAFALLILLTGYAQATEYNPEKLPPYLIAGGHGTVCVKDDDGVKCWGRVIDWQDPIAAPESLGDVKQLVMGWYHACALDENGVTCWSGPKGKNYTPPESLTDPVMITASARTSCAVDAPEGEPKHIHCWTAEGKELDYGWPEDISSIRDFEMGDHGCMIDDNGITCRGDNEFGQAVPPQDLVNPLQVSVGQYHTCAIDQTDDGNKVRCWGNPSNDRLIVPEADIENPIEIQVGGAHTCVLESNLKDVICWGHNHSGNATNRTFEYAPLLGVGNGHNCALDYVNNKPGCWGDRYYVIDYPDNLSFVDYDKDGVNNEEDAFNTNPKASVDADNDGLPDDCIDEECGGLTQDPSLNDTDNDGLLNPDDDVVGDNNPPVVLTVPGEGNVAAIENRGSELTINPPLSLLTAEDFVSEQFTWQVTVNDGEPLAVSRTHPFYITLKTGKHSLAWQAIDEAGNVSDPKIQIVNIYPAVQFAVGETTVKEAETLAVELRLAGDSPIYPITFDLEIDFEQSTINAEDLDGEFWLNAPQTFEISESGKTQVVIKTRNNLDDAEEETLKLKLTNPNVVLENGLDLQVAIALPTQHTVTIESVEGEDNPGDGNGGCDCPDSGNDNNGSDDNSGGDDNSGEDDNSGDNNDGRDAESESSGGSSGGGSTAPFLLLALFAQLARRRV